MAVPERMLVQVAVTGPRRISITVLPVREALPGREEAAEHREETVVDRRLYARETPDNEAFPTTLGEFGYRFHGDQLIMSCIEFPVNIYSHSFFYMEG